MSLFRRLGLAPVPAGVALDEMSLEPLGELEVGGWRGDVAADAHAVWFTTWEQRTLSRIDPRTRAETLRVDLPERPVRVALDEQGVIVLCEEDLLLRIDPSGGATAARMSLPEGVSDVVAGGGAMWALRAESSVPFAVSLLSLEPATLAIRREVAVSNSRFCGGLRLGDGTVCALVEDPPGSMRNAVYDLSSGEPLPDERAPTGTGIAERDGERWIGHGDRGFRRVEIDGGTVLASGEAPGPQTGNAIVAHGCVWTCNFRRRRRGEPQYMN